MCLHSFSVQDKPVNGSPHIKGQRQIAGTNPSGCRLTPRPASYYPCLRSYYADRDSSH